MDDIDKLFSKWPDWLRWILFIPISLIFAFLMRALSVLSTGLMQGFSFGILTIVFFAIIEVCAFLTGVYVVVPHQKNIFLIIFASILICLYGGLGFANVLRGIVWITDNLEDLAAVITCIVMICKLGKPIETEKDDEDEKVVER